VKLDVYDIYARDNDGRLMHLDVLLPPGGTVQTAKSAALHWLLAMGVQRRHITVEKCRLCHVEPSQPEHLEQIERQGYDVLPLEGCPLNQFAQAQFPVGKSLTTGGISE